MSVTWDFDAMLAEQERPTFIVGGQQFTARARLSYKKFGQVISLGKPSPTQEEAMKMNRDFFNIVLIPADRERFLELLERDDDEDDDLIITQKQLNDLSERLMAHYTGKGQESEKPSSDGANTTGPSSKSRSSKVVSLDPKS